VASGASSDLAFLAEAARRSIDDLHRAVASVPTEAGRRGAHFLEVVRLLLDALAASVDARETDFAAAADETERQSVVRAMRLVNYDVMRLHKITPWIDSTRGTNVGLGLVYFVDEIVSSLLKQPADVVLTPDTVYMYRTVHKPFEARLSKAGVTYPAVAPVIVAYPVQEPDALFLHLLIAHELGHSTVTEHELVNKVWSQDPDPGQTATSIAQAVAAYRASEHASVPAAVGKLRAILRSWLDELLCDTLALGLLGPSYLFTSAAFGTPFAGGDSETHPPFRLRTKILVDRLASWGWHPLLEIAVPDTFAWISATGTSPDGAPRLPHYSAIEDLLLRLAPAIETVVVDHLAEARFEVATYENARDQLDELLSNGILPAQLLDRSATDRRAIILAGWLHALQDHADTPVSIARIVGDRGYQQFLTKALEMSAVLERWASL
jgi:hypothetical protein